MAGMQTSRSISQQIKALKTGLENFRESTQKRIVKAAVGKALRVLSKGIKGKVPPNFKDIKKVIGARLEKSVGMKTSGKVGAAVGVKKKKRDAAKQKRDDKRKGRPGVGIGAENVHWFIMGTENRKTKKGKSTGKMPPQVPDVVREGVESSWPAAQRALLSHVVGAVHKEAAKLAAKVNAARSG